ELEQIPRREPDPTVGIAPHASDDRRGTEDQASIAMGPRLRRVDLMDDPFVALCVHYEPGRRLARSPFDLIAVVLHRMHRAPIGRLERWDPSRSGRVGSGHARSSPPRAHLTKSWRRILEMLCASLAGEDAREVPERFLARQRLLGAEATSGARGEGGVGILE